MSRKAGLLMAAAMMVMGEFGLFGHATEKLIKLSPNERRKCFRDGCNNHRVGRTELYCSDECKQKYREENK
jgi:hypothetical protein